MINVLFVMNKKFEGFGVFGCLNCLRFLMIFGVLYLFSGCAGLSLGGGSGGSVNTDVKTDTSGSGLEVSFKLDDEYLESRHFLTYELRLKNSGLEPVVLNSNNFKLSTLQTTNLNSQFTQTSLADFYDKVLGGGEIKLDHDTEKVVKGTLIIEESYFDNTINERLDYVLEVSYDYKTVFVENLEIDEDFGIHELSRGGGSISQAAPIEIVKLEMIPGSRTGEYLLEYSFENNGRSNLLDSENVAIPLKNLDINFRGSSILSNCEGMYENAKSGDNSKISVSNLFVPANDRLIVSCRVDIDDTDLFTTQTTGSFEYVYKTKVTGTIRLPDKK